MAELDYDYFIKPPESIEDLTGNKDALTAIRMFGKDFANGIKHKPLLLYGPSGVGKSASAHLLARELGWGVAELNASDYRGREEIEQRLMAPAASKTLFGRINLILLDEIDELASMFDKGAGSAISKLIESAKNPIIFIANDMWDQKISFLRGKTEPVRFRPLSAEEIFEVLMKASARFGLDIPKRLAEDISKKANGDARSALNDLYAVMGSDYEVGEVVGARDRKIDIFNLLDKIFFSHTMAAPLRSMVGADVDNDMLMKWIDENIPKRYVSADDMARAFGYLAEASSYYTRASREQYYTYWRYMNVLMGSGVALSKSEYPSSSKRYEFPKTIRELSATKGTRKEGIELALALQHSIHSSAKRIARNGLMMVESMVKNSIKEGMEKADAKEALVKFYHIEEDEADSIIKRAGG